MDKMTTLDRAAFQTRWLRDNDQRLVDAVKAGRILATASAVEEAERRIADRNAELAEHGYS
jgi:hypothetical protein